MIDFEAAKILDVREVARLYGVAVDRRGKGLCPFHSEKTPSFVAYNDHFHCYGCGERGDATDLVAKVLNLTAVDALKQLNSDFALGLDFDAPVDVEAIKKRKAEQALVADFEAWEAWAFRVVCRHYHILQEAIKLLAPKSQTEEPAPAWAAALHEFSKIEYWMDIFITGSYDDKLSMFTLYRNEVDAIDKTQQAIRKNT